MPRTSSLTLCAALSHGGIAHYTYALADSLERSGLPTTVPMYDEPEYDLSGYPHAHRVERSLRLATSRQRRLTSPAQNLLALARASRGREVVHFQWSLGPRNDRMIWPALRLLGKRIVYTAHDVLPHEPEIMSREHCAWAYAQADAIIVHGEPLRQLLLDNFPVRPERVQVVAHGNYNFVADTPGPYDRSGARASLRLGPDDRAVLFFGLIREYKGLDVLIEACRLLRQRGLPNGARLRLVIAGRDFKNHWQEAGYAQQIAAAGLSEQVSLHLEHIPMPEVPRFFRAADVVAIPYKRGSQSGVLQLTYSFGKAAVASRVGSLAEGTAAQVTRFVPPGEAEALAEALFALLSDDDAAASLARQARAFADNELGWEPIAARTRAIYDGLP